jgi:SpoIID/LytB domain protein
MRRTVVLCIAFALATALSVPVVANAAGPGTTVGGDLLTDPGDAPAAVASTLAATGHAFTFYGSGAGHGLGMSQWGAYGLAQQGWAYRNILTHFFSGTAVSAPAKPVRKVRIQLTYDQTLVHLTAQVAPVVLRVGAPMSGTLVGSIPVGKTWTVRSLANGYAVRDANGTLVGNRTWGGPVHHLYATYVDRGGRVFLPEADAIWNRGFTYANGYLEFNEYSCAARCLERVILPIAFESYLLGIGEMPSSWPMEALRSQAVAARTYATYSVTRYGLRDSCNCSLTDGANDQTYVGFDKISGVDGNRWADAVTSTRGEVVSYRGSVIQSFFAASDGGHSENVEDAWHGGNPAYAVAYLKGVCDPGEFAAPGNPWTRWEYSFTAATLTSRLAPYTGSIGTVLGFPGVAHAEGGRIIRATVRGSTRMAAVSGTELRAALGLPDDRMWVNRDRNIPGAIRLKYDSAMCRPGLPTTAATPLPGGSRQRFQNGGIYRNRGVDLTVWLRGPIDTEYQAAGGAIGTLGLPTSDVTRVGAGTGRSACAGCRRITFARGAIYSKTGIGAHALWGPVLTTYLAHGGGTGSLGFPTTRVQRGNGTAAASFEHGQITCVSGGTCQVT